MKLHNKISALLTALVMLCGANANAAATTKFANESLNYEIVYHWGLIWKHAASATLSLSNNGNYYNTSLMARTVSWADKVDKVRDTLTCRIAKDGLRPEQYIKTAHEGKHFSKDVVDYSYVDNTSTANCTVVRKDKETKHVTLQAPGQAYDMLSVFYYLRSLDFDSMKANGSVKTTIFSGRRKENLTVTYVGEENIKLRDKSTHNSHHVTFKFTQDGKKKSSDDIHCWISTDNAHIPLMIKGSVSVGEVRVYYKAPRTAAT